MSSLSTTDVANTSSRSPATLPSDQRAVRRAISLAFALQGFVIGSWALHVPFLVERLGITKSAMGLVIVMFGLGSVLAMALLAVVLPRTGSRLPAGIASACTSFFVVALAATPDYATTLWIAPVLSGVVGVASVALNAQGVEIERGSGRTLMSSFHGFWSMGILIGSILGGFIADAVGPLTHAWIVVVVGLGATALVWPHLVDDRAKRADEDGTERPGFALPRAPAVWVLGAIVLFAFSLDGAAIDWSALLMVGSIGAPVWLSGWPLAALQGVMMVMRFAGDAMRERIGAVPLLRWGGVLAALGFALAGVTALDAVSDLGTPVRSAIAIAGFALAGLGVANIVPVGLSLAGSVRGADPGTALAIVSAHGHLGILFMPASIGWAGERFGFGATFVGLAVLPLLIAAMAGVGRTGRATT